MSDKIDILKQKMEEIKAQIKEEKAKEAKKRREQKDKAIVILGKKLLDNKSEKFFDDVYNLLNDKDKKFIDQYR